MWFKDASAQKMPISGCIRQEKAKEYVTGLGIDDFQSSDGWLQGSKRRYDIQFRVISVESDDVITELTDQWTNITLPQYHPKDIFKADQSGFIAHALVTNWKTGIKRSTIVTK